MNFKEKIKKRFDDLEEALISGKHLESDDSAKEVEDLISSIAKFTSVLSSAERDFINSAKLAVEDKKFW
jgi:phage regulator Rha-like protein